MAPTISTTDINISSPLLKFPCEFRNRIYRYALVKNHDIHTNPYSFNSPGLFKACRTTRSEAMAIYVLENTFEIPVRDYDSDPMVTFNMGLQRLGFSPQDVKMKLYHLPEAPDSRNIVVWLRRFHARRIQSRPPPDVVSWKANANAVIHELNTLIEQLKDVPWNQVWEMKKAMGKSTSQIYSRSFRGGVETLRRLETLRGLC